MLTAFVEDKSERDGKICNIFILSEKEIRNQIKRLHMLTSAFLFSMRERM